MHFEGGRAWMAASLCQTLLEDVRTSSCSGETVKATFAWAFL